MNKSSVTDISKATADSLSRGSEASSNAFQELAKAYQALAAKNAENLTASIKAITAVKTPTEFFTTQQRLIKEAVEAAMKDSKHIAELTAAVFTSAFEPLKKQVEAAAHTA